MGLSELWKHQMEGYARGHQDVVNLWIHIVAVPLFVFGLSFAVASAAMGMWLVAPVGVLISVLAMAAQGHGHGREEHPPEPFTGPGQAVVRILLEQTLTFPLFVIRGGWGRAVSGRPEDAP